MEDTSKDYLMALQLQKELNNEYYDKDVVEVESVEEYDEDLNSTQHLVHPEWETLDPTPDTLALFTAFDQKFFQGRLKCVTLEWSKKMYSCAGICYTRRNRLGMAITIRLSEPLLKLRTRKDLIETLLHEMIHAYCSVLGIREGNGGHGPNFKKIMNGINKVAGTNITVYHSFIDEVNEYKTHWWRCNGICQNRPPFFGFVKRTSNRAPGPNDIWWLQHHQSCGGHFLKVREPEKKKPDRKLKTENTKNTKGDIRSLFAKQNNQTKSSAGFKAPTKVNGGGTVLITKTNNSDFNTKPKVVRRTSNNLGNVIGFKDLTDNAPTIKTSVKSFNNSNDVGYSLNGSFSTKPSVPVSIDKNKLRDIWLKKFPSSIDTNSSNSVMNENSSGNVVKRPRLSSNCDNESPVDDDSDWKTIDDEVMLKEVKTTIINISSDEENSDDDNGSARKPNIIKLSHEERIKQIKKEISDSNGSDDDADDIELIDDEYDDELANTNADIIDTSLIDDLFGEDTLLKEFKIENSVFPTSSKYIVDPCKDIITCPVCQGKTTRETFADHLDGCVGITQKVNPPKHKIVPFNKKEKSRKIDKKKAKQLLKDVGYADYVNNRVNRRQGLDNTTHFCPVCGCGVQVTEINEHLDICIKN